MRGREVVADLVVEDVGDGDDLEALRPADDVGPPRPRDAAGSHALRGVARARVVIAEHGRQRMQRREARGVAAALGGLHQCRRQ